MTTGAAAMNKPTEGDNLVRDCMATIRDWHATTSKSGRGVDDYTRGMYVGQVIIAMHMLDADTVVAKAALEEIDAMREPAQGPA